jgi:hypothetical protein
MIYIGAGAIVAMWIAGFYMLTSGCLTLLRESDRRHAQELRELVESSVAERASLLDRIQHPEVRQVSPSEPMLHERPKDFAEMAWVGQEVPEFVKVGDES